MPFPLNSEQQGAVDHRAGSLVLSAGAGSGKTRVLVERYLQHLREGCGVPRLAAITYTTKAAREMRSRIREAVNALVAEQPRGSDEERRWKLTAQDLETAAIDTIHGWCTSLLRTHAAAAKLDPAFTVLDEAVGATLKNESVVTALQTLLLARGPTTVDLHEAIVLFGWPAVVEAVEDFLDSPDVAAWQAFAAMEPEVIAERWATTAAAFMPSLVAAAIQTTPEIAALRGVSPATADGRTVLAGVLADLDRLCEDPANVDLGALCERAAIGSFHVRAKKSYGPDAYPTVKDGYAAIRDLLKKDIGALTSPPENLPEAAIVALRIVRVALHVQEAYAARKLEEGALDFHDLLALAKEVLTTNAAVRGQVQETVRYLLLDELQDTDPLQMDIVRAVLGERFDRGGLFAVGDVKQSIYRFRGAEVSLFDTLRAGLPNQTLAKNYRSRPGIIRFVNALCKAWFPRETLLQTVREESETPGVEFIWSLGNAEDDAEEMRAREAQTIAVRVRDLITGGVEPGDIVLLLRAMSNVSTYEEAFRELGIDYYLVGGRAFFAQQEIFDLANVLRVIENPLDSLAMVGTLRSPFCGLSDDAVMAVCHEAESPWHGLRGGLSLVPPTERPVAERALARLTAWRQMKDALPIARLIQRILAESEYDAALLFEPLGERKLANLWKLQDLARGFDARRLRLAEFIDHLENVMARQPREEQAATVPEHAAHVVRIMSIHQAKGLEFPVVIVPDLGADQRSMQIRAAVWHRSLGAVATIPGESDEADVGYPDWPAMLAKRIEATAESEESLRVLYVACTRAEELLILSASVQDEVPIVARGPALAALARAYDLTTGEPHAGSEAVRVKIVPVGSQPVSD